MSFYISLQTNNDFPNNTPSRNITKLHSPIKLNGNYEVAIVELFIKFENIDQLGFIEFDITNNFTIEDINNNHGIMIFFKNKQKIFKISNQETSLQDLINSTFLQIRNLYFYDFYKRIDENINEKDIPNLTNLIEKSSHKTDLEILLNNFNKEFFKMNIEHDIFNLLNMKNCKIKFNGLIQHLLNINTNDYITEDIINQPTKKLQNYKFDSFNVKSNIIEEQLFANRKSQILQSVFIPQKVDYFYKNFDSPHYLKINLNYIENIEISFTKLDEQEIDFRYSYLKLHFRRK